MTTRGVRRAAISRCCHARVTLTERDIGTVPDVETYLVRVWVPDRPGALGQVASRIGAVRGDVVGIEILERGAGRAIDELVVALPEPGLVDLLVSRDRPGRRRRRGGRALPLATPTTRGLLALASAAQLVERRTCRPCSRCCARPRSTTSSATGRWSSTLEPAESVVEHRRRARRCAGSRRSWPAAATSTSPPRATARPTTWCGAACHAASWRWPPGARAARSAGGSGVSWPPSTRIADALVVR